MGANANAWSSTTSTFFTVWFFNGKAFGFTGRCRKIIPGTWTASYRLLIIIMYGMFSADNWVCSCPFLTCTCPKMIICFPGYVYACGILLLLEVLQQFVSRTQEMFIKRYKSAFQFSFFSHSHWKLNFDVLA